MKFLPLYALLLLLAGITLGGLFAFAADPLLYAVEKHQAPSLFHKNPDVLRQVTTNSTVDLMPLMQDLIDDQDSIAVDIRLRDLDAAGQDLAVYTVRYGNLRIRAVNLDMNDGEIQSFLASIQDQENILASLMNNASAFDALKKIAERNKGDLDVQISVTSQSAAVKEAIQTLNSRYLSNHENVMNISTKLGLDNRQYQHALEEVQKLTEEIQASGPADTDPASLQVSRITLLVEPDQALYRDSVQIFGLVTPAGEKRAVSLLLDNASFMNVSTDLKGNYLTSYTVERIRAGEHTISAGTANLTPAERVLNVTMHDTATTLTAKPAVVNGSETGAVCNGSVIANRPVRNAPVTILFDGGSSTGTTTGEDGLFRIFLPLSPGTHTLRAQFSSDDYPLLPSTSKELTIMVPPPPIRLPDTSSWDPSIVSGVLAVVLLSAGTAAFWYTRRSKRALPAGAGFQEEPAEAVQIREELEMIIHEAEREFPPAGSAREAALFTAINSLLGRYDACLKEHGLSEAARQAYLTLAGRIAARLRLPAYRTLTPREMSRTCTTENYAGIFYRFVRIYERIRYAGSESDQDRRGFEAELQKADTNVRGDRH
jgi:hypothetical protein